MEQYISKSDLVAEIERRLWLLVPKMTFHQQRVELEKLLSFIDTLEVKEYSCEYDGFLCKELKMIDDEIARLEKLKVK